MVIACEIWQNVQIFWKPKTQPGYPGFLKSKPEICFFKTCPRFAITSDGTCILYFFSMQYGHFWWNSYHGLSCLRFCAWTKMKKMGSMEYNNFSTVRAELTRTSISAIFGIMRFFAGPTILLAGTLVLTQFLDKTSVNTTYFWPHYSSI